MKTTINIKYGEDKDTAKWQKKTFKSSAEAAEFCKEHIKNIFNIESGKNLSSEEFLSILQMIKENLDNA